MITRFALFEGHVKADDVAAFRAAVLERLVPLWRQFPGASDVRVMFSDDRDEGAPEFPLILAISYPDLDVMTAALDSPFRYQSKEVTGEIVAQYFDGRIHHHVTERHEFID
ncbi:MAG: hypothetical protein AAGF79_05020 [Pseudomonadota bacterium]